MQGRHCLREDAATKTITHYELKAGAKPLNKLI
jgi:hypothetical protein